MSDTPDNVVKMATDRISDADYADDVRKRLRAHLEAICAIVEQTKMERGLIANFQMGNDAFGRSAVLSVTVVKLL